MDPMDRINCEISATSETFHITGLPDFVATLSWEEHFGKEKYIVEVTEFTTQAYEIFDDYDEANKFVLDFLEKRIKTAEEHCDFEDIDSTEDADVSFGPAETEQEPELLEPPLPRLPPLPLCCKCCEDAILKYHREAGFPTEGPATSDSEKLDKIISLLEEIRDRL